VSRSVVKTRKFVGTTPGRPPQSTSCNNHGSVNVAWEASCGGVSI